MAVVLGEDQRLGDVLQSAVLQHDAVTEHGRHRVAQRGDDGPDLVGGDDPAVEIGGVVVEVVVHAVEALVPGLPVPELRNHAGVNRAARRADLGTDTEHVEIHVHPVGDGALVAVLHDQVLIEEAEGLLAGRRCQPDEEGVEVLEHLAPDPVDGPVALVDDDQVVGLDRHGRVVDDLHRVSWRHVEAGSLVDALVEFLVAQDRVDALDCGHVHLRG